MWEGLFRVGAGGQRTPLSDRLPLPWVMLGMALAAVGEGIGRAVGWL